MFCNKPSLDGPLRSTDKQFERDKLKYLDLFFGVKPRTWLAITQNSKCHMWGTYLA